MMKIPLILFTLIVLTACQARVQENTGEEHTVPASDQVILSDEQIKLAGIVSGKLEEKTLSEELGCNGSVEVPPQGMVSISLPMEGYVKQVNFLSGSAVHKGDLLAVMEHPDFLNLQKEYLVTGNNLVLLHEDLERQKILVKEDAASGKKLMTVKTDYENTLIQHTALGEQLILLGIDPGGLTVQSMSPLVNVYSPINGYVRENYVNVGELLKAGQPIMDLEDISHLHVHLVVYEKDVNRVKPEQQVKFTTGTNEKEYHGVVHTVGKSINEETRSANVHVHVSNADAALFSGMYVKAQILINTRTVLALPEEGIVEEAGKSYLFLRQGNSFTRVPVETGIREDGFIEIITPDLADREIVLAGAYYLNAGLSHEE
jgi:cobalt-zinc-cadmium efflux system membrane fusion protein